ncbi:MAG: acyl-CoA/acyl-ACP dehydrogenase [Acidimicrobiales bacterium]|nr:acyl-CoA/acyl-ACP dehydrogenase [Acidimicrobiales bacterium]
MSPEVISTPEPQIEDAVAALDAAANVVDSAIAELAAHGSVDADQVLAYDLGHAAAAVETGRSMIDYGAKGTLEGQLTCVFVADVVADLGAKIWGRETSWGVQPDALDGARNFVATWRDPAVLASLAYQDGPRHLDPEFELVEETFKRFAAEKVAPQAEHIHRDNADIPEDMISGLAEMGLFGLSIPEEHGGFAAGGPGDYYGMIIATEELSKASLCAAGSLITRPEILARAIEAGGTDDQKAKWLPQLASGDKLNCIAVTEPDYGSDVAGIKVTATEAAGPNGEPGFQITGVKTWCTFAARADVMMVLARTEEDRSLGHRGLSILIVEKDRGDSHGFVLTQEGGGTMEGRPIDTIGYRGMHSYEVAFDSWWVPAENLIGMDRGRGRGFYFQMAGFENGRIQTAARAVGVMQAAYEAAKEYAENRVVFGRPIADYQLTRAKLTRMAAIIQASRQFSYQVGTMMAKGEGKMEASMIKAFVCKASEWVTREAMQIHGGMGYAEEYDVSRYFVDARVLSIFEGADETLTLKVIARTLVKQAQGEN